VAATSKKCSRDLFEFYREKKFLGKNVSTSFWRFFISKSTFGCFEYLKKKKLLYIFFKCNVNLHNVFGTT
jgi:hypothetical protein